VGIAVLAAAVTPSIDPMTMLLTMVPLVLLYGLSILLASIGQKQFNRSMALEGAGEVGTGDEKIDQNTEPSD
jgi:Sec-independent protein secretion pathway component TatC